MTLKQKASAYKMLMGPYEKEWYSSNGVVDNTDNTIRKRLKIKRTLVANYLNATTSHRANLLWDLIVKNETSYNIKKAMQEFDNEILRHYEKS